LLTAYYFWQVNERVNSVASEAAIASIGMGLWLAVAGCVVGLVVAMREPDAPWFSRRP
jgi:hypothetical protein